MTTVNVDAAWVMTSRICNSRGGAVHGISLYLSLHNNIFLCDPCGLCERLIFVIFPSNLRQYGLPGTSHNYPAGQPKARCTKTNAQVLGKGVRRHPGSVEDQRGADLSATLSPRPASRSSAEADGLARGAGGSVDGRTDGIDLLAERVTQVVRLEVLRFFEREH